MNPIVLALQGSEILRSALAEALPAQPGDVEWRQFPDQETYLRVVQSVAGRDVIIAAQLDRPNAKLVDLYLLASAVRAASALRVILVAPYLPYMRQDRVFKPGEGVSASHIGRWLSSFLDGIVTVDPHLHRIRALEEIYGVRTRVVHAAPAIGRWLREKVSRPLLIGPDEESAIWVVDAAHSAGCPYLVLKKVRHGDREVSIAFPGLDAHSDRTPVLVDDIVSSGATMVEAVRRLRAQGVQAPVCVGVHAIFAEEAFERLQHAGAERTVTCNTVVHRSNAIDIHRDLGVATQELLDELSRPVAIKAAS
jgi:ribose-phosphate pyrophosphokinase